MRNVAVDNTPPIALITQPLQCWAGNGNITIRGTANDANIQSWALQVTGGGWHDWLTIATGTSPIVNNVLGVWATAGLPSCAYNVRLIARDKSIRDCTGTGQTTEYYQTLLISPGGAGLLCCDANHDGSGNGADVQAFLDCLLAGSCP